MAQLSKDKQHTRKNGIHYEG